MYSISEEFSRAAQAAFEAHLAGFHACTQAAINSGVTLIDLHVDATRSSMAAATVASQQFLSTQNPEEFMSLAASHTQQAFHRAQAYGREAAKATLHRPLLRLNGALDSEHAVR